MNNICFPTCDTTTADRLINKMKQKTITSYNKRNIRILSAILSVYVRRTILANQSNFIQRDSFALRKHTHTHTAEQHAHFFFQILKH